MNQPQLNTLAVLPCRERLRGFAEGGKFERVTLTIQQLSSAVYGENTIANHGKIAKNIKQIEKAGIHVRQTGKVSATGKVDKRRYSLQPGQDMQIAKLLTSYKI